MRIIKLLGATAAALVLAGCPPSGDYVTRAEFDEYKARIKADGDSLDAWVAGAHPWFVWLNDNASKYCPDCEPPVLPPTPPPDGGWE